MGTENQKAVVLMESDGFGSKMQLVSGLKFESGLLLAVYALRDRFPNLLGYDGMHVRSDQQLFRWVSNTNRNFNQQEPVS